MSKGLVKVRVGGEFEYKSLTLHEDYDWIHVSTDNASPPALYAFVIVDLFGLASGQLARRLDHDRGVIQARTSTVKSSDGVDWFDQRMPAATSSEPDRDADRQLIVGSEARSVLNGPRTDAPDSGTITIAAPSSSFVTVSGAVALDTRHPAELDEHVGAGLAARRLALMVSGLAVATAGPPPQRAC